MKSKTARKLEIFIWKMVGVCAVLMGGWITACAVWEENPYPIYILALALFGCASGAICCVGMIADAEEKLRKEEADRRAVPVRKINRSYRHE